MAFSSLFTITFHRQGVSPPVYIAGEFSDPPWEPYELDYTLDNDGEYTFTYQLSVSPGQDYQYKFRCGVQQWLLDESKPTEQDSIGNLNNVIRVSTHEQLVESKKLYNTPLKWAAPKYTVDHDKSSGKVFNELGIVDADYRSLAPIELYSYGAENVGNPKDTGDKTEQTKHTEQDEKVENAKPAEPDFQTPLFAHESFGAYEFVDDAMDHRQSESRHKSRVSKGYAFDDDDDTDLNDPTIEKFPSEKSSVMDTLRKIQSSLDEDPVHIEYAASSPRTSSRRTSVDSTDDVAYSAGSLSPLSPTVSRKRGDRLSHGSFMQTRSAVSLGSIAEEPKLGEEDGSRPRIPSQTSSSDEDAVVMRQTKVKPKVNPGMALMPRGRENELLTGSDARIGDTEAHNDQRRLLREDTDNPAGERRPLLSSAPARSPSSKASGLNHDHAALQEAVDGQESICPSPSDKASLLTWLKRQLRHVSNTKAKRIILTGVFVVALGFTWWKTGSKKPAIPYTAGRGNK